MAYLGENFDASSVEPAQPRELLPPGKYVAQIIESEMRDTKAGGQMLALTLEILEGPHSRRRVWDNLNLVNASEKTVEIARRTLSGICHAIGRMQVSDSEELHFKPLVITLAVEPDSRDKHLPADDPAKRYSNAVKGYAAPDGQAPARPAQAAPAPSAPRHAPAPVAQAKPATTQPPWRRSA